MYRKNVQIEKARRRNLYTRYQTMMKHFYCFRYALYSPYLTFHFFKRSTSSSLGDEATQMEWKILALNRTDCRSFPLWGAFARRKQCKKAEKLSRSFGGKLLFISRRWNEARTTMDHGRRTALIYGPAWVG